MNVLIKRFMEDIERYAKENKLDFDDVVVQAIDMLVVITGLRRVEPIIVKKEE